MYKLLGKISKSNDGSLQCVNGGQFSIGTVRFVIVSKINIYNFLNK